MTPYDPYRSPAPARCICGFHNSQAEHDHQTQLQVVPVEREEKRNDGLIASAVLQAIYPRGR
jgi:hypothetical protein